jgi:hypothetical protein
MFCFIVFWIAIFAGDVRATRLYKKLCPSAIPSIFNLTRYLKIKKCLFSLDEKDLTLSEVNQLNRLKLIIKIQNVSLVFIMIIAVGLFVKQGFKFV